MVSDRGICGSEGAASSEHSMAHAATEAYRYSDGASYNSVFTTKATPDCRKSDDQLNNELNGAGSIFGSHDTTSSAIHDLQGGIKSDSRTRHDLMNAIAEASYGNIDTAMKDLRKATTDLNDGGSKIDSGLSKLGDGGQSVGSQTIQRGMVNEADCSQNIQNAEQLLREGDTEGAINAMKKGIREMAHEQHQLRNGIASLNGDAYFNSQQQVTRSDDGGWNSTQPFTPDNSGSYQPYQPGFDYNGGETTRLQPSDSGPSFSMNLPDGFDIAKQMGLPGPQEIMDNLKDPSKLLNGLPNPFNGFSNSDSSSGSDTWPNPAKGIGSFIEDPAKPIENLLTPPKNAKDVIHKILDPIGLFG